MANQLIWTIYIRRGLVGEVLFKIRVTLSFIKIKINHRVKSTPLLLNKAAFEGIQKTTSTVIEVLLFYRLSDLFVQ